MRKLALLSLVTLSLAGCLGPGEKPVVIVQTPAEQKMFKPVKMRLHPIFTGIKNWTGGTKPDGVEAEVEFLDQFGDPTKASGKLLFELFNYRQASADPRGERLVNPYIGSLTTPQDQELHWNRTTRTYTFRLAYPNIDQRKRMVLTAIFEPLGAPRMFDQIIVQGEEHSEATTRP